jgi:hypothetical protein
MEEPHSSRHRASCGAASRGRATGISAAVYFTVVKDVAHDAYVFVTELERRLLRWDVLGETPCAECSRYGHCGPFDYCGHTRTRLDGFEPVSV